MHIEGSGILDFARSCGFRKETPVWHVEDPAPVEAALTSLYDMLDPKEHADPYLIQSGLYAFGSICARATGTALHQGHEETLLGRAKAVINSQLHMGINVTEIADILGVSRTTLFYAFKSAKEGSPVLYLQHRRIERAKELLINRSTLSMPEIDRASGFRDIKYFMRSFKATTGSSVKNWCKTIAGGRR
jgi:AraC-like DNA-binding protein